VYNDHPWDPKKVTIIPGVVIVLRLGKNTVCAKFIGLVGQGIQAGGHCSVVAVSTGLTVYKKYHNYFNSF